MHSSRMRTARLLTISRSIRDGCLPRVGVSAQGGGCLPRDGVSAQRGVDVCPGGVCLGEYVSQHAMWQTLPPHEQNDRQV